MSDVNNSVNIDYNILNQVSNIVGVNYKILNRVRGLTNIVYTILCLIKSPLYVQYSVKGYLRLSSLNFLYAPSDIVFKLKERD
jgi:hypothetical protein